MTRFVVAMFSLGMTVLGTGVVSGQTTSTGSGQAYPNKPIRIVTNAAGGNHDFTARLLSQGISVPLGQQVIVENRGGSVIIPAQTVAKAQPDGYTLLLFGGALWIGPFMQDKTPYDPVKDFAPITLAVSTPNIIVVNSSLPVKSVKELVALAKARPRELNYASGGAGSSTHLAGELFKVMAGVDIVNIRYKGGGAGVNALIGAEVQLMFPNVGTAAPHVKAGRLRALAVTSAEPSALAPGLPTAWASVPGYESVSNLGLFAPAKTPGTIINRLNKEIVLVLNSAGVKEQFLNSGTETIGSSPEQFAAAIKSEMDSLGKMIKTAGIRAE